MAKTKFISPSWRMSKNKDQSKRDTQSIAFDGSNDVTNSTSEFDTSGEIEYSLSFFIKRNSNPNLDYGYLCGSGTGEGWAISQGGTAGGISEGQFYMYSGGSAGTPISNTLINADQWYHICIVVDQTLLVDEVNFYIDGVLDKTTNTWTNNYEPSDISGISSIGSNSSVAGQWEFDGHMSQASFYDYSLSSAQVLQLSQGDTQGIPSPAQDYNLGDYSIFDSNNLNTAAQQVQLAPSLTFLISDTNDNFFKVNTFGNEYGDGYSGDFGFACWFKLTGSGTDEGVMQIGASSYDPFSVYYYTTRGGLGFQIASQQFKTGILKSTLGTGWNHMAFSTDNDGNHLFWFNGVSTSLTQSGNYGSAFFANEDLYMGKYYGNNYVMDGSISGVGFFKQELTTAIVSELYDNKLFYDDPNTITGVSNCVAYYTLTEVDTTDVNSDVVSTGLKNPTGTGGTGVANGQNQDVGLFLKQTLPGVVNGASIGRSLSVNNIRGESKFSLGTAISVNMGLNADIEDSGRSEDIPS